MHQLNKMNGYTRGRGKQLPDIYLAAFEANKGGLAEGEPPIRAAECENKVMDGRKN